MNVAVIIPCQGITGMTKRCVAACLSLYKDVSIVVVPDKANEIPGTWGSRVSVIESGVKNPAEKRNLGVNSTDAEYIAFVDDDAYPAENWLENSIATLANDQSIGAVGGPELPPEDEGLSRRCVGNVRRSFFITGPFAYRRVKLAARDCHKLSSCNMIMRRSDYLKVGGMDETYYLADDTSLSYRILKEGLRLRYDPEISVYHNNRDIMGFFRQSMVRSMDIWGSFRRNFTYDNLFRLAAAAFVFGAIGSSVFIFSDEWRATYLIVMAVFGGIALLECIRISRSIVEVPGTIAAFIMGYLGTALGTLVEPFRIRTNRNRLYRNAEQSA